MAAKGVTAFNANGVGQVNCQFGVGPWEKFSIQSEDVGYSIQSVEFPGVFLRMDGNGVTSFSGSGGGVVNGQFGVGPWEKFISNVKMSAIPFSQSRFQEQFSAWMAME